MMITSLLKNFINANMCVYKNKLYICNCKSSNIFFGKIINIKYNVKSILNIINQK